MEARSRVGRRVIRRQARTSCERGKWEYKTSTARGSASVTLGWGLMRVAMTSWCLAENR